MNTVVVMYTNITEIHDGKMKATKTFGKYVIKEVLSQKLIRKKVVFNTFSSNGGFAFEFRAKYSLSIQLQLY